MKKLVVLPIIVSKADDVDLFERLGLSNTEIESVEVDVRLFNIDAVIPQPVLVDGEEDEYCMIIAGGFEGMCPLTVSEVTEILEDAGY